MARVNVSLPDDVARRAREAGLNVSRIAAAALEEELDRRAKVAALDAYLRDLDTDLGPLSAQDRAAAKAWADRELEGSRRRGRAA